jgi:uncharacterized protein (TIGR02466 family)
MQGPEIKALFAVPFAFARHPEHQRLNRALGDLALALEAEGDKARNPRPLTQRNTALFESHFDVFRLDHPAIVELKAFCWNHLLSTIGHLNGYDIAILNRLQIYNDAWFHVTRRGGFFGLHNHPNASWSGVYCVSPGAHDANKRASGALTFVNPATASAMHMDAGVARLTPPFDSQLRSVHLEAGQLVLFPSWVLHDVKPFEGEGERITLAFNCWFTLPEAPAN